MREPPLVVSWSSFLARVKLLGSCCTFETRQALVDFVERVFEGLSGRRPVFRAGGSSLLKMTSFATFKVDFLRLGNRADLIRVVRRCRGVKAVGLMRLVSRFHCGFSTNLSGSSFKFQQT
jgi:hypothetical protein